MGAYQSPKSQRGWIERQLPLLLTSKLDEVLTHIKAVSIKADLRDSVFHYLEANRGRENYASYQKRGLLVGSAGPISMDQTRDGV